MQVKTAETIEQNLKQKTTAVEAHPVFEELESIHHIRMFLEFHVYAVWDFMTLLEAFQNPEGRTQPWMPPVGYKFADDFVHRVGYREMACGRPETHFDEYYGAMRLLNAEMQDIAILLDAIEEGYSTEEALNMANPPAEARQHVQTTLDIAETGNPTRIAGAILARRDIIPDGFSADLCRVLKSITPNQPESATVVPDCFAAFDQPMEFDWEQHANRVLHDVRIDSTDAGRQTLIDSAKEMTDARLTLLDGIENKIQSSSSVVSAGGQGR